METISPQELIAHDAPKRHKLSVHVISAATEGPSSADSVVLPPENDQSDGLISPALPSVSTFPQLMRNIFMSDHHGIFVFYSSGTCCLLCDGHFRLRRLMMSAYLSVSWASSLCPNPS